MIKAVIFDFFGVLEGGGEPNEMLLTYIRAKLKPKYKIGVISNSAGNWLEEILTPSQAELFDEVVLSYQVGYAKPEPPIYEIALKNLGIRAEEGVFIDDLEGYCVAARSLGMKAVHYQNFEQMERELEDLLTVSDN